MLTSHLRTYFLMMGSVFMISACSGLSTSPRQSDVLDQVSQMQQWSEQRLIEELPGLKKNYTDVPTAENGLKLAVAMDIQCVSCDSVHVIELLKTVVATSTDNRVVALASLYIELFEMRATATSTRIQLQNQQQQIKQLQKKLDALTSIEESLHQRE